MKIYLRTQDVALEFKVTIRTIERWRETGYFVPEIRTGGGHSRYTQEQVQCLKQQRELQQMMY